MTPPVAGVVRCLSPARRDHWFHSPDRVRVRICDRCRRKFALLRAPQIFRDPSPAPR